MAERDKLHVQFDFEIAVKESAEQMPVPPCQFVVVALDQNNRAVKPVKITVELRRGVAEAEIAKMVHQIVGSDDVVPVGDQCFVHLSDRGEGPVAVFDDVGVTEMGVAGEESLRHVINGYQ